MYLRNFIALVGISLVYSVENTKFSYFGDSKMGGLWESKDTTNKWWDGIESFELLVGSKDKENVRLCELNDVCRSVYVGGDSQLRNDVNFQSLTMEVTFAENSEDAQKIAESKLCEILSSFSSALTSCLVSASYSSSSIWTQNGYTSPSLLLPYSKFAVLPDKFSFSSANMSGLVRASSRSKILRIPNFDFQFSSLFFNLFPSPDVLPSTNIVQMNFIYNKLETSLKLVYLWESFQDLSVKFITNPAIGVSSLVNINSQPVVSVQLHRNFENDGFHRNLVTKINLENVCVQSCTFMLIEFFPESIYVDPFEINEIKRFGGLNSMVFGSVDIEKPVSHASQVIVASEVANASSISTVSIPIHIRYHSPGKSFAQVTVLPPMLYLRNKNDNVWIRIPSDAYVIDSVIPTGIAAHGEFVRASTVVITISATILLLFKSLIF